MAPGFVTSCLPRERLVLQLADRVLMTHKMLPVLVAVFVVVVGTVPGAAMPVLNLTMRRMIWKRRS